MLTQIVNPDNFKVFVSIASIAELKSIALQNSWGAKKWQVINAVLDEVIIIEMHILNVEIQLIKIISLYRQGIWVKMIYGLPEQLRYSD